MRQKEIDQDALRKLRGIGPSSIPDYLALTGDSADGIPGLSGFGEKGAAVLLARYEHLENIPDDARAWDVAVRGADRLAATLRAERESAMLYRKLATLVCEVPLAESLSDLAVARRPPPRVRDLLRPFRGLRAEDRPQKWRDG